MLTKITINISHFLLFLKCPDTAHFCLLVFFPERIFQHF